MKGKVKATPETSDLKNSEVKTVKLINYLKSVTNLAHPNYRLRKRVIYKICWGKNYKINLLKIGPNLAHLNIGDFVAMVGGKVAGFH